MLRKIANHNSRKESDIKSIAWNDQFEDLLCFTSSRLIGIRMHDFPTQTIEVGDYLIKISHLNCDEVEMELSHLGLNSLFDSLRSIKDYF